MASFDRRSRVLGVVALALGPLLALASMACIGDDEDEDDLGPGIPVTTARNVVVSTAADLARLATTNRVTGDLIIRPAPELGEAVMPALRAVDGSVRLESVDRVAAFRVHLPALARVGTNVEVRGSSAPISLELDTLTQVGGHLDSRHGGKISLLCPALRRLNGDLRVEHTELVAVDLRQLAHVGGALRLERYSGGDPMAQPPGLLLAFPALETVLGPLRLRTGTPTVIEAPVLTSLGDIDLSDLRVELRLPALLTITGDIHARRASLDDPRLTALRSVGGEVALAAVTIERSGSLRFPSLAAIGVGLTVDDVGSLRELVLDALTNVGGLLRVHRAPHLQRVSLARLVRAASDVQISSCGNPLSLEAPALEFVGGSLILDDDAELTLALPRLATVSGTLRARGTLVRAFAFPLLERIGQSLELHTLASRELAVRLPALESVGGSVRIERMALVRSFALPRLFDVGSSPGGVPFGSLVVSQNPTLATLDTRALRNVAVDVRVRDNPALSSLAVETAMAGVMVGGQREICGNEGQTPCP